MMLSRVMWWREQPRWCVLALGTFDFCDFVTYTLTGIAFALCLYVELLA